MQELHSVKIELIAGGTGTGNPYPPTTTDDIYDHTWTKPEQEK